MYHPRGVAIDKARIQIVVANYVNNRIDVFSETGEYICQLYTGIVSMLAAGSQCKQVLSD